MNARSYSLLVLGAVSVLFTKALLFGPDGGSKAQSLTGQAADDGKSNAVPGQPGSALDKLERDVARNLDTISKQVKQMSDKAVKIMNEQEARDQQQLEWMKRFQAGQIEAYFNAAAVGWKIGVNGGSLPDVTNVLNNAFAGDSNALLNWLKKH